MLNSGRVDLPLSPSKMLPSRPQNVGQEGGAHQKQLHPNDSLSLSDKTSDSIAQAYSPRRSPHTTRSQIHTPTVRSPQTASLQAFNSAVQPLQKANEEDSLTDEESIDISDIEKLIKNLEEENDALFQGKSESEKACAILSERKEELERKLEAVERERNAMVAQFSALQGDCETLNALNNQMVSVEQEKEELEQQVAALKTEFETLEKKKRVEAAQVEMQRVALQRNREALNAFSKQMTSAEQEKARHEQQLAALEIAEADIRERLSREIKAAEIKMASVGKHYAAGQAEMHQLEIVIEEKIALLNFMAQPLIDRVRALEEHFFIAQKNKISFEKLKSQQSDESNVVTQKEVFAAYHASLHKLDVISRDIEYTGYAFQVIERNEVTFIEQCIKELKFLETQHVEPPQRSDKSENLLKLLLNRTKLLALRSKQIDEQTKDCWNSFDTQQRTEKQAPRTAAFEIDEADAQKGESRESKATDAKAALVENQGANAQAEVLQLETVIKTKIKSLDFMAQPLLEKVKALEQYLAIALTNRIYFEKLSNQPSTESDAATWTNISAAYHASLDKMDVMGRDICFHGKAFMAIEEIEITSIKQYLKELKFLERLETQPVDTPKRSDECENLLESLPHTSQLLALRYRMIYAYVEGWRALDKQAEDRRKEKEDEALFSAARIALRRQSSNRLGQALFAA